MEQIIKIHEIKIGQRVKVKGTSGRGDQFKALEVELKPAKDHETLEGELQAVDAERREIVLMGRPIQLPEDTRITDRDGDLAGVQDLKARSVVKVVGRYSEATGLVPTHIRMKETLPFNIDKLQGQVDRVDPEARTLHVLGFTIGLSDKTVIEGL